VLRARIAVPDGVDTERRYLALLPVGTATLRVVVTPGGPPTPTDDSRTRDA
jgi:hypothetical protein